MQSLPQHPLQAFIAPNTAMRSSVPSIHCNTEHHRAGRQTTLCPSTLDAREPVIPSVRCKITVAREQRTYSQPVSNALPSNQMRRSGFGAQLVDLPDFPVTLHSLNLTLVINWSQLLYSTSPTDLTGYRPISRTYSTRPHFHLRFPTTHARVAYAMRFRLYYKRFVIIQNSRHRRGTECEDLNKTIIEVKDITEDSFFADIITDNKNMRKRLCSSSPEKGVEK
ncbi:hypothetical protein WA026_022069 [Henosepilachna vigintioctopunctata]|uniref:Uncharacterized protein n=1 Tax=Henosepilachna vigintioctopunctata TaxID=420089 RepID=A0AAW1UGL5_9CUCU